ncbi:MAG: hypothetical protein QXI32_01460 [Candidatus Bathyarchaeia archaeon]
MESDIEGSSLVFRDLKLHVNMAWVRGLSTTRLRGTVSLRGARHRLPQRSRVQDSMSFLKDVDIERLSGLGLRLLE